MFLVYDITHRSDPTTESLDTTWRIKERFQPWRFVPLTDAWFRNRDTSSPPTSRIASFMSVSPSLIKDMTKSSFKPWYIYIYISKNLFIYFSFQSPPRHPESHCKSQLLSRKFNYKYDDVSNNEISIYIYPICQHI